MNKSGVSMIKSIGSLVVLLFTIVVAEVPEQQLNHWFQAANLAYREGDFHRADSLYQQILKAGYENAALYYNLGNTHYKLGHIGKAIYYYRKALQLNPGDADVQKNLRLARLKVVDKIELPPEFFLLAWWHRLTRNWHYLNYWKLVLAAWWVLLLAGMGRLMVKNERIRSALRRLMWISGVVLLMFATVGYAAYHAQVGQKAGVVFSDVITVRSAPESDATELFILHEGSEVLLLDQRGEWVKIQLLDGKSGWVPREAIGII